MGIRTLEMFLLPLLIMCVSIVSQAGGIGNGGSPGYNGALNCGVNNSACNSATQPFTITCNPSIFDLPCNVTTTINNYAKELGIAPYCTTFGILGNGDGAWLPPPPAPAYCSFAQVIVPAGTTIQVNGPSSKGIFGIILGPLGTDGFTAILLAAAGVVVLSAISLFSSGENPTGTRILFFTIMSLGMWGLLSVAESSITTGGGFFQWIDKMIPLAGTSFFVILTLFYVAGTLGLIAGNSGG
jgi:hypothetical protein